jgi:hypothetical protein
MKYLYLITSLLLVGCRGSIHPVGEIGAYTVYSGKVPSAAGPSMNFVALQKDTNEVPIIIGIASGNGVSTTVLQAGAIAGAATLVRPAQFNNTSSTVEVVPEIETPLPPVYGPPAPPQNHIPPYRWGPHK